MPRAKAKPVAVDTAATPAPDAAFAANQEKVVKPGKGNVVTIGCKLPHGIVMRLQRKETITLPNRSGGMVEVTEWHPDYEKPEVTIFGTAVPHGQTPKCLIENEYAMTPGVDAEFARAWFDQNKNLDMVKNRMVIFHERQEHVSGVAKDMRGKKSGLDPLQPDSDLRIPKKKSLKGKMVSAISSGSEE